MLRVTFIALVTVAVVLSSCWGLAVPRQHDLQHALKTEDGKEASSLEWHELDYLEWGSSSYENYDSEEHHHDPITIASVEKNKTVNAAPEPEVKKEPVPSVHLPKKEPEPESKPVPALGKEVVDQAQSSKVSGDEKRIPIAPVNGEKSVVGAKESEEVDEDDDWDDSEEADWWDDWETKPLPIRNITEGGSPQLQLPSDNDSDSEKYFDPQRWAERVQLHLIEDIMNQEWTVNYPDTGLPCILLRGDIKMIVPMSPNWFNLDYVELIVPKSAQATGTCLSLNNDYQEILLAWNATIPGSNRTYLNTIYFGFSTNWTSEFGSLSVPADKYALTAVTAAYYNAELNFLPEDQDKDQGIASYSVTDLKEFETPLNQSMSCLRKKSILLKDMQLTFENMQIEAFRPNTETLTRGEFSESVLCDSDEIYVFDALMTFIIWFWIGALFVVIIIFTILLALGYRRKKIGGEGGFGYKILQA